MSIWFYLFLLAIIPFLYWILRWQLKNKPYGPRPLTADEVKRATHRALIILGIPYIGGLLFFVFLTGIRW